MRPKVRVVAMGRAAVLVAAGTAGCGSGGGSHSGGSRPAAGGPASAVRVVQAAYTASTSQKTATFRLEETISATSSAGSAENVTITGSGQADFAARAFRVSMNSPSGGAVTVLQAGGTEYVQVPAAQRNQVPGRKPLSDGQGGGECAEPLVRFAVGEPQVGRGDVLDGRVMSGWAVVPAGKFRLAGSQMSAGLSLAGSRRSRRRWR